MKKASKIYVAGHTGLVGSAVVRTLKEKGYKNLITYTHENCDLTDPSIVNWIFSVNTPEYVFMAAAKVGGINANMTCPGEFIRDNLLMQTNIMDAARRFNVKKLLFLGSSCVYPKFAKQPIKEKYLMTSLLEPTNIGYAIAKIAGIEMCKLYRKQWDCNFISVMPGNLYGENDNFSLEDSHVFAAMIRKFHEAKINNIDTVQLWGTGHPKREFLYVGDLVEALVFLMNNYNDVIHINVGTGIDITLRELAKMIGEVVDYKGEIKWDTGMPDGTPRKLLSVSKINKLGWKHKISLQTGVEKTYKWFVDNYENARK